MLLVLRNKVNCIFIQALSGFANHTKCTDKELEKYYRKCHRDHFSFTSQKNLITAYLSCQSYHQRITKHTFPERSTFHFSLPCPAQLHCSEIYSDCFTHKSFSSLLEHLFSNFLVLFVKYEVL